jgi:hypothetical protein
LRCCYGRCSPLSASLPSKLHLDAYHCAVVVLGVAGRDGVFGKQGSGLELLSFNLVRIAARRVLSSDMPPWTRRLPAD